MTWPELLGLPPDTPRWQWDYQVYDENHKLVWAKDLAQRYKSELRRRQRGDYSTLRRHSFKKPKHPYVPSNEVAYDK